MSLELHDNAGGGRNIFKKKKEKKNFLSFTLQKEPKAQGHLQMFSIIRENEGTQAKLTHHTNIKDRK
jgi:hypothetical protein